MLLAHNLTHTIHKEDEILDINREKAKKKVICEDYEVMRDNLYK
jgi:hypothetical protein